MFHIYKRVFIYIFEFLLIASLGFLLTYWYYQFLSFHSKMKHTKIFLKINEIPVWLFFPMVVCFSVSCPSQTLVLFMTIALTTLASAAVMTMRVLMRKLKWRRLELCSFSTLRFIDKNCFGFKSPCSMIFSSSIDEDQYYGGILLPVSGNLEELAVWSPGFQHPERHEILRHHCANHWHDPQFSSPGDAPKEQENGKLPSH